MHALVQPAIVTAETYKAHQSGLTPIQYGEVQKANNKWINYRFRKCIEYFAEAIYNDAN